MKKVLTGRLSFGSDYAAAEKFCDEQAGDTCGHAAVVEDFTKGEFLLMDGTEAASYVEERDAEIQYDAGGWNDIETEGETPA